jgi:hypothetical protein
MPLNNVVQPLHLAIGLGYEAHDGNTEHSHVIAPQSSIDVATGLTHVSTAQFMGKPLVMEVVPLERGIIHPSGIDINNISTGHGVIHDVWVLHNIYPNDQHIARPLDVCDLFNADAKPVPPNRIVLGIANPFNGELAYASLSAIDTIFTPSLRFISTVSLGDKAFANYKVNGKYNKCKVTKGPDSYMTTLRDTTYGCGREAPVYGCGAHFTPLG